MKRANDKNDFLASNNPDDGAISYEASIRYIAEQANKRA